MLNLKFWKLKFESLKMFGRFENLSAILKIYFFEIWLFFSKNKWNACNSFWVIIMMYRTYTYIIIVLLQELCKLEQDLWFMNYGCNKLKKSKRFFSTTFFSYWNSYNTICKVEKNLLQVEIYPGLPGIYTSSQHGTKCRAASL